VAAVVVVPLLLLVVEFASCVASCLGSVDDEVPAAVKQETGLTPVSCVAQRRPVRCLYMPFAPAALVEKNWMWFADTYYLVQLLCYKWNFGCGGGPGPSPAPEEQGPLRVPLHGRCVQPNLIRLGSGVGG